MSEGKVKTGSLAISWLVRCWEEPREQEPQGDPVLRCFIRDLKTGEERYLSDPRELGELMREAGKGDEEQENQETQRTRG